MIINNNILIQHNWEVWGFLGHICFSYLSAANRRMYNGMVMIIINNIFIWSIIDQHFNTSITKELSMIIKNGILNILIHYARESWSKLSWSSITTFWLTIAELRISWAHLLLVQNQCQDSSRSSAGNRNHLCKILKKVRIYCRFKFITDFKGNALWV